MVENKGAENVQGLKIIADTIASSKIYLVGKIAEFMGRSVFVKRRGLCILENSGNSSK